MFPVLFSVGPVAISSLGVFSFLAFLLGAFLFWRAGKEEGFEEEALLDLVFLSLSVGLILGRLVFIGEHWPEFSSSWISWLDFRRHGGASFTGTLLGAAGVIVWFSKRQKWNPWIVAEMGILPFAWSQILLRIGQFLDGSYYGRTTSLFLGLPFPGIEGRRYPIQLFEVVVLLLLVFWLRHLAKQYRLFVWYQDKRGEARPGFLVLTYLLIYSLFRFLLAFAQEPGIYWGGLRASQWLSLVGVAAALVGFGERKGQWEVWLKRLKEKFSSRKKSDNLLVVSPKIVPARRSLFRKKHHIKAGSDAKI